MKIALIIDDSKVDRNAISDLLKRVNIKVDNAVDGSDGIKKVKKTAYDLIVLDLKMPGVDGEQVLRVIKKVKTSLPVLIVSGYLTKARFLRLQKLGVKKFLTKPIDINKFYNAVKQLCPMNNEQN